MSSSFDVFKRLFAIAVLGAVIAVPAQLHAQAEDDGEDDGPQVVQADSLDELLQLVEERRVVESREHEAREQRFIEERAEQQEMLEQARQERADEEQRSERLEATFDDNELRIAQLQERLDERLGALREMFGVLQEVAGDTRSQFQNSIVSAEYPNRGEWLGELARQMGDGTRLASIEQMERLWFELQREMTESGKVKRFTSTVNMLDGEQYETDVIRVGSFNVIADGRYINYDREVGRLVELPRQPSGRFTNTVGNVEQADPDELVAFGIDPQRGALMSLLVQGDTWGDRVGSVFGGIRTGECYLPFCDGQGGLIGSIIILGGIVGVLLALERLVTLGLIGRRVNVQKKSEEIDESNPLGRVLKVYEDNKSVDMETLELKLGEAILAEQPALTRNIVLIQVISAVAPLLGLLGTVTGMIVTFQAITLFGTGDPQTMADGISTALVTTMLGLTVAIPTVLLHSIVNTRSRAMIHVLEEQTAGIIAEHAERQGKALG